MSAGSPRRTTPLVRGLNPAARRDRIVEQVPEIPTASGAPDSEPRRRARVLFLNGGADLYGADRVLFHAVTGLDRDRFEPLVVLNNPGPLADRLRAQGIETHCRRLGVVRRKYFTAGGACNRLWHLSRAVVSLIRLIRRQGVEVVYSNTCNVLPGALAAFLTRRLHVLHLQEILVSPAGVWRILARYFSALSHQILATSSPVREHVRATVPRAAERTAVVPDGIDAARFVPSPERRQQFRRVQGLTDEQFVVGMVARVNPRKGHEVLLEAATRLAGRLPHVRWVVVGDAFAGEEGYRDALIEDARRRGLADRVRFEGYHDALEQVYPGFDLLISPSPFPESFGLVLVEAMACAVPVIATRHGGPLDIVLEGETGLLVPPGDAPALADAVGRLAGDPALRARMGENGRARVLRAFTVERFQARINGLLAVLVETRRGRARAPE